MIRLRRLRTARRRAGALAAALVSALWLAVVPGPALVQAADPEPRVNTDIKYDIDPGPGWPPGWTPPDPPAELPQARLDLFAYQQRVYGAGAPKRIEMRVLSPLPAWTREYPYVWHSHSLRCGDTEYVYYFPYPDRELLYKTYGDGYRTAQIGTSESRCLFGPINVIKPANVTPEDWEEARLSGYLNRDFARARLGRIDDGGLTDCIAWYYEGTPQNIPVCFNTGYASERFDAPAYLDVAAGRVRVPLRFVSELMGADVHWDEPSRTVTIHFPAVSREVTKPVSRPGYSAADWVEPNIYGYNGGAYTLELQTVSQPERTIVLTVGEGTALVDGRAVPLDAPPVVVPPGRTMVPVRFVAEAMGAKVYWVGDQPTWKAPDGSLSGTYQVHIFTPFYPFFEQPSWFLETRAQRY